MMKEEDKMLFLIHRVNATGPGSARNFQVIFLDKSLPQAICGLPHSVSETTTTILIW